MKGMGGGLDIVHSIIMFLIAIVLLRMGIGGEVLSSFYLILLSLVIIVLEVAGIAM
jgi:hypothetical protein